ncbi:hypothetical protein N9N67_02290 [Bacteriovoracaceae bacterium]|nr:hypothetical protein [Bacteriovoracaceae bacterium]
MKYTVITFLFINMTFANIQFRCVEYDNNRKVKTCILPLYSETQKTNRNSDKNKIWLKPGEIYRLSGHKNCLLKNLQLDLIIKNVSPPKEFSPIPTDTDFADLQSPTIFETSLIKYQVNIIENKEKRESIPFDVKVKAEISNPALHDLPQKDISFIEAGSGLRCTWKLL